MKTINYIWGVVAMLAMTSCGGRDGNSVSLDVKPELGTLGEYLTIDASEATITLSEVTEDGEPCIKIMATLLVTVNKAVASNYDFDLDAEVLDKDMNKVSNFPTFRIETQNDYNNRPCHYYLSPGTVRATVEVSTTKARWDNNADEREPWEKICKDGAYLALKPQWNSAKYEPYGTAQATSTADNDDESETVAEETTASTSGEDWNAILDKYEKYCDQMVSLAKKVKAGDVSVMTEYASALESAQELQTKLDNAKNDMTAAQAARLSKIAAKMSAAMM